MAVGLSWRCVFLSSTVLMCILLTSFYLFFPQTIRHYDPFLRFKRDIAEELNEIHREMRKMVVQKQAPSPRLVQRLRELVKRIDNRLLTVSAPEIVNKDASVDVCPDEYRGGTSGYPFYHTGWFITNCTNAKPIASVISILVNTVAYPKEDENNIEKVLMGVTETYPTVQVYLATRSGQTMDMAKRYKNIEVMKVDEANLGKGWNMLIRKVSTPYVLVARDVFHFTWLSQLERQIRVVSQIPNVVAVGGSYRNYSGHWKTGCVQTTMKNYVLEYQEGYYHSKNECMFCDYLQGPFVTKTKLLKFDESLPNEVIFDDWFLRVFEDGNLTMSCPDAMYFTTDHSFNSRRTDKNVWQPLAKKWELNRVLLSQGVKHSFSCEDVGLQCVAQSQLLPFCCQEEYADALAFLQRFSDENNIAFELDAGSALGGVKFSGLIPWAIDGDVIVLTSDIEIFGKRETVDYFRQNGYNLTGYKPAGSTYVVIKFNGFDIKVWGMAIVTNTQYLPPELRNRAKFTKVNIRGKWIETAFSPGLVSRNRYGREILKHSQSWGKVELESSFSDYNPGSFAPCEKPEHHACVQNFPADGNIPFLVT